LRERLGLDDNLGTTAKQAMMVWACAAKEDNDWVKKCMENEVEGGRLPGQEFDQRELGDRLWKKTARHVNRTGRISWIVKDGGSR